MPCSSSINKEVVNLKGILPSNQVAALTSDLFPNQARKLIAEIANGNYKVLFLTPESFLYWFSSGFNSMAIEHYRKLSEDDLGKQVFINTQGILERISRVVLCEFELFSKDNAVHKPKYNEAVWLIHELEKPILALSSACTKEPLQQFLRLFPRLAVIQESLQLSKVSLQAKYCFSRADKQKMLLNLLKQNKPTLVYVSPHEDLADLVNFLRAKLPNNAIKAFHQGLPTEQKAEALDYFLKDPCPTFITSSHLMEGISRPDIVRLIHYSPPNSLADFYREIQILGLQNNQRQIMGQVTESHLLVCEDDLMHTPNEKNKIQVSYNKDGLMVDSKKLTKQIFDWVSKDKGCRWQNLEEVLTSDLQSQHACGICDLCRGDKNSFFTNASMFLLKGKFN